MMSQREAVYTVVCAVVGEVTGKVELSKSQKEQVHAELLHSFQTGLVELKGDHTDAWLKKYIPGLVNNWCRKDKRLNGDVKYTPKNPGSRAGSGDEALKAMKTLLAVTTDPSDRAEIEAEIERRKLELKPAVELKVELIPEHLRRFIPPTVRKVESGSGNS